MDQLHEAEGYDRMQEPNLGGPSLAGESGGPTHPGASAEHVTVDVDQPQGWPQGLFGCLDDFDACLPGTFCPAVAAFRTGTKAKNKMLAWTIFLSTVFKWMCCLWGSFMGCLWIPFCVEGTREPCLLGCALGSCGAGLVTRILQIPCYLTMRLHIMARYRIRDRLDKGRLCLLATLLRPCQVCQELKTVEGLERFHTHRVPAPRP